MPTYSNFYNLIRFTKSEALSTNDFQFTSRNIDVVDQVLHKLENAVFSGDPAIDSPDVPTLETDPNSGTFPANRTVRYKITWVDEFGAETAASDESVISTPTAITRPGAPGLTVVTTGGTLKPGNYFYALSAYTTADTIETPVGTQTYITARPTTSTNVITLTLPTTPVGADGFNIYRRAPGETQFYWLISVDTSGATPPTEYEDDGSVAISSSRTPQNRNLTNSSNSITVTVSGATPVVPQGYTWKIYRTMESGNYNASFLKWVIEETYAGSGVVVPYYEDTGISVSAGIPPTQNEITASVSRIETLESTVTGLNSHAPNLAPQSEDITFDSETLVGLGEMSLPMQGGRFYSVDLYLMYSAEAAEDMKIQLQASDGIFSYTILPDDLVLTNDDIVTLAGTSSATPGNPLPVGIHIIGTFDLSEVSADDYPSLQLYAAKKTESATPLVDATIYQGSWLRII